MKEPELKPTDPGFKLYHDIKASTVLIKLLATEAPELVPFAEQHLNELITSQTIQE